MKIASIQTSNACIPVSNRKERGNTLLLAIVGSACLVPHLQTLCLNLVDSFCIIPLRYDLSFPSIRETSHSDSQHLTAWLVLHWSECYCQDYSPSLLPWPWHPSLCTPSLAPPSLLVQTISCLSSLSKPFRACPQATCHLSVTIEMLTPASSQSTMAARIIPPVKFFSQKPCSHVLSHFNWNWSKPRTPSFILYLL